MARCCGLNVMEFAKMTSEKWMKLYKQLQSNERIEIIESNATDIIFRQLGFLTQDDVTLIQEMNQIAKQAGMMLPTVYRQIF